MMVALILKWVGLGLSTLTILVVLLGLVAWLAWFQFPRFSAAVSELMFKVSTFSKHLALGAAKVASAPFRAAGNRMDKFRGWARNLHLRSRIRLDQLATDTV